jgi:hypothetical protein
MSAAEILPADEWTPWATWVPSMLSHHGEDCCSTARAWFLAMNRSLWRGHGGPGWIAQRFPWGPVRWPLHWCTAMEAKELDCGAHAALTIEAFQSRGVRALPVQLVQRQEPHYLPHFHGRWAAGGAVLEWAARGATYHEACATIAGGRAEVWDATVSAWLSPDHIRGVTSIAAIRIGGPIVTGEEVLWRGLRVPLGEWVSSAEHWTPIKRSVPIAPQPPCSEPASRPRSAVG